MIVVRNCFVARPGHASKLAAQLKEAAAAGSFLRYRVLTDLTSLTTVELLIFEIHNYEPPKAPTLATQIRRTGSISRLAP